MKILLAILIAMMSAVLGAIITGNRALERFSWPVLLGIVAAGGVVAEGITVLWMGPPGSALPPGLDGLALGLLTGWVAGRRRKKR